MNFLAESGMSNPDGSGTGYSSFGASCLCASAIVLFSTIELLGKWIGSDIHPTAMNAYRFLIGALVLFLVELWYRPGRESSPKEMAPLRAADIIRMAIPGVLNIAISMNLLHLAVFYGKASLSAILISSNPVFVALLAWLFLKERVTGMDMLGMMVGLAGIVSIVSGEHAQMQISHHAFLGIVCGVLASLTFALYTVLSKPLVQRYGNVRFNAISFLSGAIVLIAICLPAGIDLRMNMTPKAVLGILYMGIMISGVGYLLFFAGLKRLKTARGSMFFFLKPLLATLLAHLFLGERITWIQWAGMGLVMISILLPRGLKPSMVGNLWHTIHNRPPEKH